MTGAIGQVKGRRSRLHISISHQLVFHWVTLIRIDLVLPIEKLDVSPLQYPHSYPVWSLKNSTTDIAIAVCFGWFGLFVYRIWKDRTLPTVVGAQLLQA